MHLDKYTQLLIGRSKSAEILAHEFRLRHMPNINLDKLIDPDSQIRLDSIKKILNSNTDAKLALLLRLLSIANLFKNTFLHSKST